MQPNRSGGSSLFVFEDSHPVPQTADSSGQPSVEGDGQLGAMELAAVSVAPAISSIAAIG